MAYTLKHDVSFSEFTFGKMQVASRESVNREFWLSLQEFLEKTTKYKWQIDITDSPLGQTLADKEEQLSHNYQKDALDLPLVKAIMAEFAGAKIDVLVRKVNNDNNDNPHEDLEFNDFNSGYMEEEN